MWDIEDDMCSIDDVRYSRRYVCSGSKLLLMFYYCVFFFFFQAEDGIRDVAVTGVQTCALPIFAYETSSHNTLFLLSHTLSQHAPHEPYTYLAIGTYYLSTNRISEARRFFSKAKIGRASCRERV